MTAGSFDVFGGRYVPETLVTPLVELELAYRDAIADVAFVAELDRILADFVGL